MFRHCLHPSGVLRKCKRCYACAIVVVAFVLILRTHESFLLTTNKTNVPVLIKMESKRSLSLAIIDEDRSETLRSQCNRSKQVQSDIRTYSPAALIKAYPWLNGALFPLLSRSLLYCAVPKVASKTLISLIIYVHVRDILESLKNDSTQIEFHADRPEQFVNVTKLIEQLRKVGEKERARRSLCIGLTRFRMECPFRKSKDRSLLLR